MGKAQGNLDKVIFMSTVFRLALQTGLELRVLCDMLLLRLTEAAQMLQFKNVTVTF